MFASILPEHVAIIALAALLIACVIFCIATFRSKLASAKKEWLELSTVLAGHGLPHCSKIMEDLAVGDLPGAFRECEYLLRLMRDPKHAAAALDAIFAAQLPIALNDAGRRTAVAKVITDWINANPTLAPAVHLAVASAAVST